MAVNIQRNRSQPSAAGPASYFFGRVPVDPLFSAPEPALGGGADLTFEPGAHSNWHTHPLGRTLIVTCGYRPAQSWGGPVRVIGPGDVVWCPPGEKHWRGAMPGTPMSQIAIREALDGKVVEWLEPVTDAQYAAARAQQRRFPTMRR
jgi:quercetin dioxygenase-like cupin family protein